MAECPRHGAGGRDVGCQRAGCQSCDSRNLQTSRANTAHQLCAHDAWPNRVLLAVLPARPSLSHRRRRSSCGVARAHVCAAAEAALILFAGFSVLGLVSGLCIAAWGEGTPLPFVATNRLVTSGP